MEMPGTEFLTSADGSDDRYQARLRTRNSPEQIKTFARFNDAILWMSKEFDAGDGYAEYGEIRHRGTLLWRKRSAP